MTPQQPARIVLVKWCRTCQQWRKPASKCSECGRSLKDMMAVEMEERTVAVRRKGRKIYGKLKGDEHA